MDNTSDIQVISDQSKIPFADVDPKLQSATDKSSDILEKFVIAENEDDLVKAYQMAEEKLVCILLELDAHPTDDTGDRKQAVDYVLHCTKLLDQRAQRKAKDKLHEIERKLQDGTSTADCAERLQRRRDDLRKLLRSLKDDSTETPVGDGNEMNVPSAKSTSPEENIEEIDEEIWSHEDQELLSLDEGNEEVEEEQDESEEEEIEVEEKGAEDDDEENRDKSKTLSWMTTFLLYLNVWKSKFNVSDSALAVLLAILKSFLLALGNMLNVKMVKSLATFFPETLYKFRKTLGLDRDDFTRYVVCPSCDSVYTKDQARIALRDRHGNIVGYKSAKCSFVEFPAHNQRKFRRPCGTVLMKTFFRKDGRKDVRPKRTFCYRSIVKSLQDLTLRPGFFEDCEKWRNRNVSEGVYGDIYDGKVWADFQYYNGKPFLSEPCNLGLMFNIDWFQPYDNVRDSVGVMYLVIMNLPREQRFLRENIIVIGIIPGPREPARHINAYLNPLIEELKILWHGVYLSDTSPLGKEMYRAALLCLSSDIPATRKSAGFLGHMANKACSKCLKAFPRDEDNNVDYSGFHIDEWEPRTKAVHVDSAERSKSSKTRAEQKRIEAEFGARYSSFLNLPYFDPIRMHVVDPMHNLLEGTAKRVLQMWKETNVLSNSSFKTLQSRVDNMKVPSDLDGGLPGKIEHSFDGFKAAQWKHWVCTYSLYALKGIINVQDYNIWNCFVTAARILCNRLITTQKLHEAHECLKIFCNTFQRKYGKKWCSMNMHMHLHLKQCIHDYGPVHAFWCFAFERANYTLGNYQKNNRDAEVIIMRKWLLDWQTACKQKCEVLGDNLVPPVSVFMEGKKSREGHVLTMEKLDMLNRLSESDELYGRELAFDNKSEVLLPPLKSAYMTWDDNQKMLDMFKTMFPDCTVNRVSLKYTEFDRCSLSGELVSSEGYRTDASSCIYAKWLGNEDTIDPSAEPRPGVVSNMMKVSVFLNTGGPDEVNLAFTLAEIKWFKVHGDRYHYGRKDLCSVWEPSFEPFSHASFMPLKRIVCRCAYSKAKVPLSVTREETVYTVVPLSSVRCV
ncbi:uncharacterized protein LOC144928530 isoform X3 [Branchiostoma floridae x Branchiostoma belcheri]